ncbi:phasin family protein [Paenibacillus pinihumi]|uniref:phasin family protein n=1 Tax=Paenibacillus pinihumi TaxID=669462 RepID=UPI0004121540|nr:ATP synthase subunit B [Paenibacillus pinihumi]
MRDLINKAVSLGLGIVVTSKEQVEKLVDELVQKGEIGRSESSSFVDELISKGEESRRRIDDMVKERVEAMIADLNLATRADIERLEQQISRLERENNTGPSSSGDVQISD